MKPPIASLKNCVLSLLIGCGSLFVCTPIYASHASNFAHMSRGVGRILTAAFQVPIHIVKKTLTEPLVLGTLDGVITGAYHAVTQVAAGTFETAAGAAPYAKYAVFLA